MFFKDQLVIKFKSSLNFWIYWFLIQISEKLVFYWIKQNDEKKQLFEILWGYKRKIFIKKFFYQQVSNQLKPQLKKLIKFSSSVVIFSI